MRSYKSIVLEEWVIQKIKTAQSKKHWGDTSRYGYYIDGQIDAYDDMLRKIYQERGK